MTYPYIMNVYLQQITEAINRHLAAGAQPHIDLANAAFVLESDVRYEPPASWLVSRSKLVDSRRSDFFDSLFEGGPSWIHGNLIVSENIKPIVSLATGDRVGNPHPSINVSIQCANLIVVDS